MNNKILLLLVAILAIGLFAMPSTLSLFAGQHTFDKGADVKCEKCHQDIYNEMSVAGGNFGASSAHTSTTSLRTCTGCHKVGNVSVGGPNVPLNKTVVGFYNRTSLSGAHAAVTMECEGCHTGVPAELKNINESHGPFYNASKSDSPGNNTNMLLGSNEACIGCHTHININATWRRSVGMNLIVNETETGQYNISFAANKSFNVSYTNNGSVTADGLYP